MVLVVDVQLDLIVLQLARALFEKLKSAALKSQEPRPKVVHGCLLVPRSTWKSSRSLVSTMSSVSKQVTADDQSVVLE